MFKKLLIANRGTIAIRIIRACRELDIATLAIYSTADKDALHVRMADEAVCIGPAAAEDSYLNIPAIISTALTYGADAVHPGYGFLSENGDFAEACRRSGVHFVGPLARHIRLMGDKPRARRIMQRAGVPVLPGSEGKGVTEVREALADAKRLGFPVLIKAAAGGGGKGMRVARDEKELSRLFALARAESEAAFGSRTMYLEKYLEHARHVEFQILADTYRNVIHMGERDCSIQRRHQKVLE
jgi:acetyl-CoA carboxylase biotin carboxylase subunit